MTNDKRISEFLKIMDGVSNVKITNVEFNPNHVSCRYLPEYITYILNYRMFKFKIEGDYSINVVRIINAASMISKFAVNNNMIDVKVENLFKRFNILDFIKLIPDLKLEYMLDLFKFLQYDLHHIMKIYNSAIEMEYKNKIKDMDSRIDFVLCNELSDGLVKLNVYLKDGYAFKLSSTKYCNNKNYILNSSDDIILPNIYSIISNVVYDDENNKNITLVSRESDMCKIYDYEYHKDINSIKCNINGLLHVIGNDSVIDKSILVGALKSLTCELESDKDDTRSVITKSANVIYSILNYYNDNICDDSTHLASDINSFRNEKGLS